MGLLIQKSILKWCIIDYYLIKVIVRKLLKN